MPSNQALNALGHAVSGSIGTAISTAALYPLDLVTTRLKAQSRSEKDAGPDTTHYDGVVSALRGIVAREGGVAALYRGLGEDVAKSVADSFLFFGFYSYLRPRRRRARAVEELAVGALAGACARAVTTPMANVVARRQAGEATGTVWEVLAALRRQGGLWSGYSATLVLTLNPGITFLVDRRLAARIIPALEDEDIPVAWIAFLIAAWSKATATAVMYPFQTGKTRLQMAGERLPEHRSEKGGETQGEPKDEQNAETQRRYVRVLKKLVALLDQTIFGVIFRIIKDEGVLALYAGIRGELLKSFFSHGLTMLTKGLIHRLVIRLWYLLLPYLKQRRLQLK